MTTQFQTSLAERFANISDVSNVARLASPLSQFTHSDLGSIIRQPIDIGPILSLPPVVDPTPPPLTPGGAGTFIGTVAQTPEQAITAAIHAARVAFEAIPVAQNGDEIDAAIPNGFRSAVISLLSLAEATVTQLTRPRPIPRPPIFTGPPLPPVGVSPPIQTTPPIGVTPPIQIDPGIIHISPGVLGQVGAAINPAPATTQPAGGADPATPAATTPQSSLPLLNLGGQLFQPVIATHPETGATTTLFAPVSATGLSANLSPVAGGGFHVTLDSPAPAAAVTAAADIAAGTQFTAPNLLG